MRPLAVVLLAAGILQTSTAPRAALRERSLALANGRVYIRGAKQLFAIK